LLKAIENIVKELAADAFTTVAYRSWRQRLSLACNDARQIQQVPKLRSDTVLGAYSAALSTGTGSQFATIRD